MFSLIKNCFVKNTARKPVKRNRVRLSLEALEERWCPAAETVYWSIHAGGGTWSNLANWKNGDGSPADHVPTTGDTAIFDSNKSYFNCTVDVNTQGVNVVLQNAYTAQFQVNSGQSFKINNFTDNNPSQDSFNVQLNSGNTGNPTTFLEIFGAATFYNFGISDTGKDGSFLVDNVGTLTMGDGLNDGTPYNINVGVELTVDGGRVNIGNVSGNGTSPVYFKLNRDTSVTEVMQLENIAKVNVYASSQMAKPIDTYQSGGHISIDRNGSGDSTLQFQDVSANGEAAGLLQTVNAGIVVYTDGWLKILNGYWDVSGNDGGSPIVGDSNSSSIALAPNSSMELGKTAGVTLTVGFGFEMAEDPEVLGEELVVYNNSSLGWDTTNPITRADRAYFWYGYLDLAPKVVFSIGMKAEFGNPNDSTGEITLYIVGYIEPTSNTSSQLKLIDPSSSLIFNDDAQFKVLQDGALLDPGLTWTLIDASVNAANGLINNGLQTVLPPNVTDAFAGQKWQLND